MVIGQRSAYTEDFVAFLNETKKEKEMITADQVCLFVSPHGCVHAGKGDDHQGIVSPSMYA